MGGTPTANVLRSPPPYPSPTRGEGSAPSNACTFRILLDGKPVRTPAKALLAVPSKALAEAIAGEWEAQREHIDPADHAADPARQLGDRRGAGAPGRGARRYRQVRRQRSPVLSRVRARAAGAPASRGVGPGARLGARGAGRALRGGRRHHAGDSARGSEIGDCRGAGRARRVQPRRAARHDHADRLGPARPGARPGASQRRSRLGRGARRRGLADRDDGARTRKLPPAASAAGPRCRPPAGCWRCSADLSSRHDELGSERDPHADASVGSAATQYVLAVRDN